MNLTDEEVEKIADKAAEKAVDKALKGMYEEVGRSVLKKAAYVVGLAIIFVAIWLNNHGFK